MVMDEQYRRRDRVGGLLVSESLRIMKKHDVTHIMTEESRYQNHVHLLAGTRLWYFQVPDPAETRADAAFVNERLQPELQSYAIEEHKKVPPDTISIWLVFAAQCEKQRDYLWLQLDGPYTPDFRKRYSGETRGYSELGRRRHGELDYCTMQFHMIFGGDVYGRARASAPHGYNWAMVIILAWRTTQLIRKYKEAERKRSTIADNCVTHRRPNKFKVE